MKIYKTLTWILLGFLILSAAALIWKGEGIRKEKNEIQAQLEDLQFKYDVLHMTSKTDKRELDSEHQDNLILLRLWVVDRMTLSHAKKIIERLDKQMTFYQGLMDDNGLIYPLFILPDADIDVEGTYKECYTLSQNEKAKANRQEAPK